MAGGEDDDDADVRTEIRKELSTMSFEEIQKLKDKMGAKVFNEAYHGKPLRKQRSRSFLLNSEGKYHKEKGGCKNQGPTEESAKKRVLSVRKVVTVPKAHRRDPRFDGISGHFDPKSFRKNYEFVGEMKASEKQQLKRQLRKETDPAEKKKIKLLLQRMENQERTQHQKEQREEEQKTRHAENIARLKEGKKPVFRSKKAVKREELAQKYLELKESGKLEKYMQRQRKKNAVKSKKQLLS